jgi:hypothetical protein
VGISSLIFTDGLPQKQIIDSAVAERFCSILSSKGARRVFHGFLRRRMSMI